MREQPPVAVRLVEFGERGHMVKERSLPGLAQFIAARYHRPAQKISVRAFELITEHVKEQWVMCGDNRPQPVAIPLEHLGKVVGDGDRIVFVQR